jgi:hypothetical protein
MECQRAHLTEINKIISGFNLGLYRIARLENLINLRGDVLLLRLRRLIKSLVVKMADAPGYDFLFALRLDEPVDNTSISFRSNHNNNSFALPFGPRVWVIYTAANRAAPDFSPTSAVNVVRIRRHTCVYL